MRSLKQVRQMHIEALRQLSPSPALDVDLLLCHVLELTPVDLILREDMTVDPESEKKVSELVERRRLAEPIAYLIGHKPFMGYEFEVDHRTLIPRPDTEIVVEAVLELLSERSERHILDIGTGSGAILISLLLACPSATGVGLDVSTGALEVAARNGVQLGIEDRVKWVLSDLFSALDESESFDLIISNPPYINQKDMLTLDKTVAGFEPHSALFGGEDGLDFYRKIISKAASHLKPQGYLAFEIGYDQRDAVVSLLEQADFECITCYNDLKGHHRAVVARLKPM